MFLISDRYTADRSTSTSRPMKSVRFSQGILGKTRERPRVTLDELLLLLLIVDGFIVLGIGVGRTSFPRTMLPVHRRYDVDGRTRASVLQRNRTIILRGEMHVPCGGIPSGKDDLRVSPVLASLFGKSSPVHSILVRSIALYLYTQATWGMSQFLSRAKDRNIGGLMETQSTQIIRGRTF